MSPDPRVLAIGRDAAFESAASLATDDVPLAYPDDTIAVLRARLAARRPIFRWSRAKVARWSGWCRSRTPSVPRTTP